MKWEKIILISLLCLTLSACSNTVKQPEKTVSVSRSKKVTYDSRKKEFLTPSFTLKFLSFETKQDIEDREGLFVYAEITNLSKEPLYPESIWSTYVAFVDDGGESRDSFYPTVLTKEELDGSEYKTAVDQMSRPLKHQEKSKVGYFCAVREAEATLVLYDDEHLEVARELVER